MSEAKAPGFFARLAIAWWAYMRIVFDAQFAASVQKARVRSLLPGGSADLSPTEETNKPAAKVEAPKKSEPPKEALKVMGPESALQLLALFQREGRLIDFLEEDVSGFSDAQIGAAARVVHEGCKKALHEHLPVEPVRSEEEGAKLSIEKGFDASKIRLTGNVTGEPPFRGTLAHRGWRVREVKLPKLAPGHDAQTIAPAEVEL